MQEPANSSELPNRSAVDAMQFPHIPGYRFRQRLGQGGMATVYLATQESLDRLVSIKVMERDALQDETSKQRFEHEARTIARLAHAGIVGIHEVGRTSEGQMYYIMPYLANGDLSQRDLRNDEPRIVDVLRTLLSALDYAHAHGIVHRDVKEENVLFDASNRPQLTDFGIALSKNDTSRITTAGFSVGSSGYMAPEQARAEQVDGRADLYSVGVLTYALLTGDLPFFAPDPLALALMHAQNPIPRLPPGKRHWQGFIDRAMAKSPAQRFDNAQQMLQALGKIGRRSGDEFSTRVLRTFDRAVDGDGGRHPLRMLALTGALLVAIGVYVAQQRAADRAGAAVFVPAPTNHVSIPAPQPLPAPIAPPKISPADVQPLDTATAKKPDQPATQQRTHSRARHTATHHRSVKQSNWLSRLFRRR